jgi:hypothetical protein
MNVTVSSIDLTHPERPVFGDAFNLTVPMELDHLSIYTSDNRSRYSAFELVSSFDNPVLVERRALVLVSGGAIYVMNVSNPMSIALVNRSVVEYGLIDDFIVAGRSVLIFTLDGHLTRVDLADPYRPSTHPTVKIPGIPLGAAASGDLVFTWAHWSLPDRFYGSTLNGVRIENKTAKIVWAVQLTWGGMVVEGERAYILGQSSEYHYYSDYIYGVTNDTYTNITILDLSSIDGPRALTTIEIKGSFSSLRAIDGLIVMGEGGYEEPIGLIIFDARNATDVRLLGLYEAMGGQLSVDDGLVMVVNDRMGCYVLRIGH